MYETKEEAQQKLSSTVVLFNDSPVYVQEAAGSNAKLSLVYTWLKTGETRSNRITEPGWDFRNLGSRIGYTNVSLGDGSYNESLYLTRAAVRRAHSTQGLSHHNVKIPRLRGAVKLGLGPTSLAWQSLYPSEYFISMMEKKYPSLEEVSKELQNPWVMSRAFNRQFAVRKPEVGPYFLEYRGRDVGHSDDLHRWKISEQFNHLKEHLDHINLKVS